MGFASGITPGSAGRPTNGRRANEAVPRRALAEAAPRKAPAEVAVAKMELVARPAREVVSHVEQGPKPPRVAPKRAAALLNEADGRSHRARRPAGAAELAAFSRHVASQVSALVGDGAGVGGGAASDRPLFVEEVAAATTAALVLHPHQLVGVEWLLLLEKLGANGILADDMGLGKTIEAIAYLSVSRARAGRGPAPGGGCGVDLVVAPASVLANWLDAFATFSPHLRVGLYHGEDRVRVRSNDIDDYDVLVTTLSVWEREDAKVDRAWFCQHAPWTHLIVDEGHVLKNPSAARTRRLGALKCASATILSGTPVQNAPVELMCLLKFLNPKLGGFEVEVEELRGASDDASLEHLTTLGRPFVLRRLKTDVLSLPQKTSTIVPVHLSQGQRRTYDGLVDGARRLQADVEPLPPVYHLSLMIQLRKAVNHPLLLPLEAPALVEALAKQLCEAGYFAGDGATEAKMVAHVAALSRWRLHELGKALGVGYAIGQEEIMCGSAKFEVLAQMLPSLKKQGSRVLLFSQWRTVLDIIEALLASLGLRFCRLDGKTEISTRKVVVDAFNAPGSPFDVFLLTTRAGGLGLNLVSADTVIIFDADMNPECDRQAEDRAYRIGQSRDVSVYTLVAQDTIDADIYQVARGKAALNCRVLADGPVSAAAEEDEATGVRRAVEKALLRGAQATAHTGVGPAAPVSLASSATSASSVPCDSALPSPSPSEPPPSAPADAAPSPSESTVHGSERSPPPASAPPTLMEEDFGEARQGEDFGEARQGEDFGEFPHGEATRAPTTRLDVGAFGAASPAFAGGPPPASVSAPLARRQRSARGPAVNYAEPSASSKLRRPSDYVG
ncbi:P-loop containing nucleoside triphosphate hydrolase protein [Pelagophyceae sp. CCMP2097]|nr:P-loop containing nucleoside triphosphate hydrolase protein [Pelagophyceae sp. CCMP2097]